MSLSAEDQKGIDELVDKYKKDGRFDEVRRKHLANIMTDERFLELVADAEQLVDEVFAKRSATATKNEVRQKLLRELDSRFLKPCEAIALQQTASDESLMTLIADIRPRVEAFLGLSGVSTAEPQQMEENHQVCDMDIESESEHGVVNVDSVQLPHALSDIQLPPAAAPPSTSDRNPLTPVRAPPSHITETGSGECKAAVDATTPPKSSQSTPHTTPGKLPHS